MPVILATWEAEIRKIVIPSQHRQKKVHKSPLQQKKAGPGGATCHSSDGRKCHIEGWWFRLAWAKTKTQSPKQLEQKGLETWLKR
jgi:hypothetical protein